MLILCYALLIVYVVAVNLYGVLILKYQKKEDLEHVPRTINDGKLILTGILGGALGIYVFMFIYKHRLKSLMLMLLMPLLTVINVYMVFVLFSSNFGIA